MRYYILTLDIPDWQQVSQPHRVFWDDFLERNIVTITDQFGMEYETIGPSLMEEPTAEQYIIVLNDDSVMRWRRIQTYPYVEEVVEEGEEDPTIPIENIVYKASYTHVARCPKNYIGTEVVVTKQITSLISVAEASRIAKEEAIAEAEAQLVCNLWLSFEDVETVDKSFTASYSIGGDYWVSEKHDYQPNMYLAGDKRLASFDKGILYEHNVDGTVCKFYGGQIFDDEVEVPFSPGGEISKVLHSITWETEAITPEGGTNHDETFDKILVYNNEMCSGYIAPTHFKGLRDAEGTWRFNKFKNLVINRNLPIILNNEPNSTNLSTKKAWFKKDFFLGKYFIVRYKHSNISQNNLYIYNVDAIVRKSDR